MSILLAKYIENFKEFKKEDIKKDILALYRQDIMKINSLYREKY